VRAKVLEQTQAVTKQYLDAQQKAAPAGGGTPAAPAAQPSSAQEDVKKLQEDLKAEIAKTKQTVAQLTDLGVPIGWDKAKVPLYPFPIVCQKDGQPDYWVTSKDKCKPDETAKTDCWAWAKLVFALLLGGLLVGLGGPFWYDTVMGLSNIRNIATSVFGSKPPEQQPTLTASRGSGETKAEEKPQPKTPVDIFEAARAAREAILKAQGRA
jgi:hypothetical protein